MFCMFAKMSVAARESALTALFQGLLGASEFPPHVRLFDCLRAISGNQVLHSQKLPCNNYGVKWHLATQEGICPLAAPFPARQRSEVTNFSGKVHFSSALKQVESPDSRVY